MSYARKLMKLKVMELNEIRLKTSKYHPFRIEIFKEYMKI